MLLSVVVPVHAVAEFLPACLDSLLGQELPPLPGDEPVDLEVIAVDDCSPDTSPAILDRYAAADPRMRVRHLDRNVGLGPARNAGMEWARGDYLLFLDSDDTLAAGALAAIADRLRATGEPDVLIVDHVRTYPDGSTRRNVRRDVLQRLSEPAPFTADDHPEIFQLLQVAWNKVYRAAFVRAAGLSFPPGYYEDTTWTHLALLRAATIATLPRVCVAYRQRAGGSILSSRSRKHFDAVDQWRRLFEQLAAAPELGRWRELLVQRAADHYVTVLMTPHRLDPADRRAFHAAARAQLTEVRRDVALLRPAVGADRSLRAGVERWLLAHAPLRALDLERRSGRLVRRAGGRLRRFASVARRRAGP